MELVRLVEEKVLSVVEKIFAILDGKTDYHSFEIQLKKELDSLGCDLLGYVIETLKQKIEEEAKGDPNWKRIRKNDRKEILTLFGPIVYYRSYYQHRENKKYTYLVDQQIGVSPHSRVGTTLKAELAEAAVGMSYEAASVDISRYNPALKVSKQTVSSCVKEFNPITEPLPQIKRQVSELYIEADEDHVKVKGRKGAQARLVYVHEGIEDYPRRHLRNVKYFTSIKEKPEELWWRVLDYLEANYELSSTKQISLSGDGAPWIRLGIEYIPGAIFILDKFHLAKYILMATAHAPELKKPIYRGIRFLNKQNVLKYLNEALERAQEPPRQKRIIATIKYIEHNWDGIENAVKNPHIGCSAEGHVSHILAARLSSRPMSWSLSGAEKMANMRVAKANGDSISKQYLNAKNSTPIVAGIKEEMQKELKRLKQAKLLGKGNHNNIPLFSSDRNPTRMVLKALNKQSAV
jgi:hypothetical protein